MVKLLLIIAASDWPVSIKAAKKHCNEVLDMVEQGADC